MSKVLLTAAFILFASAAGSGALACEAENFVLSAGKAFTAASRQGSPSAFMNAARRYTDMRGIAYFALGPHRKKMPPGKESEFVRLSQEYMGKFMSRYATRFNAAGMQVVSCSGSIVNAEAGGRRIVFRVARRGGGYRLEDVNISSIWLANQMRSTFTSIINRNGGSIDALFAYLRS